MLGKDLFALLEAASRSPETTAANQSVKAVVTTLVDHFGNAPRWNAHVVDDVISRWVSMVMR
jgi:hypothetical protein